MSSDDNDAVPTDEGSSRDERAAASADDDAADPEAGATPGHPLSPERRRFLGRATVAIGASAAGLAALPALVVVHDPLGETTVETAGGPIDVGSVDEFPAGTPVTVDLRARKRDAWSNLGVVTVGRALVTRQADGSFVVFSTVCPHAGCGVSWVEDEGRYRCPCHESDFAADGSVTGGPSPRGLDPLEHDVADGRLRIVFQRFVTGTADRTPA